ncbi:MAG: DUF166 family protein [Promethearchaeota archaeon]
MTDAIKPAEIVGKPILGVTQEKINKDLKILIMSDGKYGDRAVDIIGSVFPKTEMAVIPAEDPTSFLDEYEFPEDVEAKIEGSDLIISYIRHPDVNMELAYYEKPLILAVYFGQGFFNQVHEINEKTVMPLTMCRLSNDTGIKEVDEYATFFGVPEFDIKIKPREAGDSKLSNKDEAEAYEISSIRILRESPCGAAERTLHAIMHKPISPEIFTTFSLFVSQECREPVSVLLKRAHMGESAASLHRINVLETLRKNYPQLFKENSPLKKYLDEKRAEYEADTKSMFFL